MNYLPFASILFSSLSSVGIVEEDVDDCESIIHCITLVISSRQPARSSELIIIEAASSHCCSIL